jgi:tRNA nucleotidyltransferase (CCA-adding enzyme)
MEARAEGVTAPMIYFGLTAFRLNAKEAGEFSARLKFSNSEAEMLKDIIALREESPVIAAARAKPSEIYRALTPYSDEALATFAIAADDPRVCERIEQFRTQLRGVAPELTGADLKKMGIPPGPRYREILTRLHNARLDGIVSNRAQEEDFVKELGGKNG